MRTQNNALVRDKIPDKIRAKGFPFAYTMMSVGEYGAALRARILEDANAVAASPSSDGMVEAMGELLEIMLALAAFHGFNLAEIQAIQERTHEERGGFARRVKLLWVEYPDETTEEDLTE
jgi:predicted house-cleaning noncanonical NTP pyrophosphatase (MazG superfamily)